MNIARLLCFFFMLVPRVEATGLPFTISAPTGQVISLKKEGETYVLPEYHRGMKLTFHHPVNQCRFRDRPCDSPIDLSVDRPFPGQKDALAHLSYRDNGKLQRLNLQLISNSFPSMLAKGQSAVELPIIFASSPLQQRKAECDLVVLDHRGVLLFHRFLPLLCMDFRPHEVEGKTFYSYQEVRLGIEDTGTIGPRVILDDQFRQIERLDYEFDGHEFLLLGKNHWVAFEMAIARLHNGRPYLDRRIRERQDGRIVFDWGNSDFLRQGETEATLFTTLHLYKGEQLLNILHLNSIQRFSNGDMLVGLGPNGVAYVDRSSKRYRWVLGGLLDDFKLPPDQHPIFQHTALFDRQNKTLLLYSNFPRPTKIPHSSRVLRYTLNENEKSVLKFEVLRGGKELSMVMGAVQQTDQVFSVSVGLKLFGQNDFVEFKGKEETLTIQFLGEGNTVYRFYRGPFGE